MMRNYFKIHSKYEIYFHTLIFFLALFALSNCGFDTSEGRYHYQVAVQIIKHGQLGFDTLPNGVFQVAPNGRFYAGHEIGNTLFMLPTAFINVGLENILSRFISQENIAKAQQFILSFQAGIYSSLTATIFFAILRLGFLKATIPSFLATLYLALTTYFWTYSRNLFDGVLCTTLLTTSFFLILIYRQRNNLWYLFGCFFCLGFGFITRVSMILAILVSFAYLVSLYRSSIAIRIREISLAIFTLIPFFVWQSWYNYLRTGIFYKSPVQTAVYAGSNSLDGNIFVGLTGLLFSPGKSLFIYAPLLILSVILFKKFYREHQKEAIYVVALAVLWFLLHARLRNWYGASGWGPRYFITILPILFLPFAVNLEYVFKRTALKISTILLASFGFILALSSIISNWHHRMSYIYEYQPSLLSDGVFVWGFWNSQSVDMLKTAFGNILRILTHTHTQVIVLSRGSEANAYASSTINIWPNSFIHTGIPWFVVVALVTPLIILIYLSTRNILRLGINLRREKTRQEEQV
ncbi:MAG: hypothetical protein V7L26_13015 [Nostoc sp.]|uniref:hypothetical protein n=1 Tax=Nostoc sp. TaxID=1180 RepID=UPI002FEF46D5